jgi:hypothetical protein
MRGLAGRRRPARSVFAAGRDGTTRRFGVVIEVIAYSPNSASPTKPAG